MHQLPRNSRHPAFRNAHLDLAESEFARRRAGQLVIPRVLERGRDGGLLPSEITVDIPDLDQRSRYKEARAILRPIWESAVSLRDLFPHASTCVLFHLLNESEIVWLEDPKPFPYLRQEIATTARRTTPIQMTKTGRLVGYAILKSTTQAIEGRYHRRFFRIKEGELAAFGSGSPGEAVKVSSIAAGKIPESGRD